MLLTTLNKIREHEPCTDGWKKLLTYLGKTKADDEPLSITTILDSNGLNDALWCLRAVEGYDREIRLYAVWCARQVQHLLNDQRSLDALDVAEKYANGQATQDELDAAKAAAWAARDVARDAWAAVRAARDAGSSGDAEAAARAAACTTAANAADAAWSAARSAEDAARAARAVECDVAGTSAACAAAWDAAWDAVRAAALDATWAAAEAEMREKQADALRRICEEG